MPIMARPPAEGLTPRETAIMQILWDAGKATVEEVRAALPDCPNASTVRTLLRILVEKRRVSKREDVSPHVYSPAVPQSKERQRAVRGLLKRFFGGSPADLVVHLLEEKSLSPESLADLRRRFRRGPNSSDSEKKGS